MDENTHVAVASGLMLEFLEAIVHEYLYCSNVYPRESFESRTIYDVPVHMSRHPQLCSYIHDMLQGCKAWIQENALDKIRIVLFSDKGEDMTSLVIQLKWTVVLLAQQNGQNDEPFELPVLAIEEAFRSMLVKLIAYPPRAEQTNAPHSFRLFSHTTEGGQDPNGTVVNSESVANSWVLANSLQEEKQSARKTIQPISSASGPQLPLQMQMYYEQP